MKRGDIYFADLDPAVGNETQKRRPVLIVSNNANNKMSQTITVIPITSNITKIYPFEVYLDSNETGLTKASKAQCHQVRTISKIRIQSMHPAGHVSTSMTKIASALMLHLDL